MATDLENLLAARSRLCAKLADCLGNTDHSVDGESETYSNLLDQLEKIDARIAQSGYGSFEIESRSQP